ncbi:glycosyltransferase [Marinomonas agarivorans]|nr:glycosyltransferase [Marinomonas agarivorans]
MKIFYGVQATGNGHITRARAMAPLLKDAGIEVTYLFSGRDEKDFFDMECFGDYQVAKGLSFVTKDGALQLMATLQQASIRQLFASIKQLDLSGYDLVLTDFEPITAWAAKRQGKPCIGLGHQYAFAQDVPRYRKDPIGSLIMKCFAPAPIKLGAHWHHFGSDILPPIIHVDQGVNATLKNKVLVYLPFEKTEKIMALLSPIKDYQFHLHCKDIAPGEYGNITVHPFSLNGFKSNLQESESVLCNAGFELVSESLQMGKRIMVKPLKRQVEQLSNALALESLSYAKAINVLSTSAITDWLNTGKVVKCHYPDVAQAVTNWLKNGAVEPISNLCADLWQQAETSKTVS